MDKEAVIKIQLLNRALKQAHMARDIVGRNAMVLFDRNTFLVTIARTAEKYYYQHKDPMSKSVFDASLDFEISNLVHHKKIDPNATVKFFRAANKIFDTPADMSDKMTDMINRFVRNRLGHSAIIHCAALLKRDPKYDIVNHVKDSLAKIDSLDITGENNQVIDVYHDYDKEHEAFKQLNKDKIPMGLDPLDDVTSGGLAKGEVGLINAASGQGKTTMLSNFSVYYAQHGYNVFHISLEELESQMLLRFARESLRLTPDDLFKTDGTLNPRTEKEMYKLYKSRSKKKKWGHLIFYRTSPRTLSVDHLYDLVISMERIHHLKFDVVVIDYPDLLLNKYHSDSESENGSRLFQDLRKLAQTLNVVLWTASQLNRGANMAQVKSASNLEGSYRKINTVELSLTINHTEGEFSKGYLTLNIDKLRNRNSFKGSKLYLKVNPPTLKITAETPQEQQIHNQILAQDNMQGEANYRQGNDLKRVHKAQKKRWTINIEQREKAENPFPSEAARVANSNTRLKNFDGNSTSSSSASSSDKTYYDKYHDTKFSSGDLPF